MNAINTLLIVLGVVVCASSTERQYYADEEKANSNERFVIMRDETGKIHYNDLTSKVNGRIANISDVSIYLYTSQNPNNGFEMKPADFDGTINSKYFNPNNVNIFITHGWLSNYLSRHMILMRDALLQHDNTNVFVIDWSKAASEFYQFARKSVPIIGENSGEFINKIMAKYNISPSKFILCGFSLGGHIVGAAGATMKGKPSIIIGLDPAKPLFYIDEPHDRLDTTDGEFVQVLHTSAGLLGFKSSIGHADYYPNGGGVNQPGCGSDLGAMCAHHRSILIYAESLITGGFKAYKCSSYEDFKSGSCNNNEISFIGEYNIDTNAHGDYYLETADAPPFALN